MKSILDLLMKIIGNGEKQYLVNMETINGDEFAIMLKAFDTEEALRLIEDITTDGCIMKDMKIIDEFGNEI